MESFLRLMRTWLPCRRIMRRWEQTVWIERMRSISLSVDAVHSAKTVLSSVSGHCSPNVSIKVVVIFVF